jgi:shikimate dehydrogenase
MRTYGLIGYPLGHSFSRKFFTEKFVREQKEEQYVNFEIFPIDGVIDIVLSQEDLAGLNVTIPYKTRIIPFLDELDHISQAVGAVNTIRIERSAKGRVYLKGFNTDVAGFTESLKPLLKAHHRKALVLGTGGASRAVKYALGEMGITSLMVSRSEIAENIVSYSHLTAGIISEYKLIINTTPLGTFPDREKLPLIPYGFLTGDHLLYDLVYNPPQTRFMEEGLKRGATVKNGYEMLELQALKAYEIWNTEQGA